MSTRSPSTPRKLCVFCDPPSSPLTRGSTPRQSIGARRLSTARPSHPQNPRLRKGRTCRCIELIKSPAGLSPVLSQRGRPTAQQTRVVSRVRISSIKCRVRETSVTGCARVRRVRLGRSSGSLTSLIVAESMGSSVEEIDPARRSNLQLGTVLFLGVRY